ncbi:MAG: pyruvate kinase [Rhodospirillaceae bacterium]|nr:pyruvate kinase [Rhodospirillaceae bacterium]MBT7033162.1 pyruvate kinase [Rhodospirillaceae bacterium]MBT7234317.1 pyruvate kinase [Rhodospirillaceae bacterium]
MRRHRAARIVSTLGPSSSTPERIRALYEAGTDVFRLNFSHGTHAEQKARYDIVRGLEAEFGHPAGIIMDLQGPKIRVGAFTDGSVQLVEGAAFHLDGDSGEMGSAARASITNPEIFPSLEAGAPLLLDDGKIRLRVIEAGADFVDTEVEVGGVLSDSKGVNIPGALLALSALTKKDRRDLQFGLELGADWVALSFVQRPEDVAEARKLIGGRAGVLVKLEKPLAIEHLDQIVELADAVMVARGDLGVEAPPEDVPGLQKKIIAKARDEGKPVIVATQMLESMIGSPTPTRAEASDVATAVFDGADAVMLSAETAAGDYPVEAVAMMDRIIRRVEGDGHYQVTRGFDRRGDSGSDADAITAAARTVAHAVRAAAIVTFTTTGSTTLRASRVRPDAPILALTPELATARRLVLAWGVHPVHTADVTDFSEMVEKATFIAKAEGFAKPGQRLVVTAGLPFGTPGATNVLRIIWVN